MAVRIFTELCAGYPGLTPQLLWREYTRSQVFLLLRDHRNRERERLASAAAMNRASVSAAMVNVLAGKDVPEFDEFVADMFGGEHERVERDHDLDPGAAQSLGLEFYANADESPDRWQELE
jgi:hypothetical protein